MFKTMRAFIFCLISLVQEFRRWSKSISLSLVLTLQSIDLIHLLL